MTESERRALAARRMKEYDPMPDLRARNGFLRRLQEIAEAAEQALRNAEEAT